MQIWSEEKSVFAKSGWSSSAWNIVGTPGKARGRLLVIVFSTCPASKRGSITIRPPFTTVRFNTQVLAKTWNSGNAPSTLSGSFGSKGSIMSTWIALLARLAWLSIAPLGVPVVPPVYCSSARSSVERSGRPPVSRPSQSLHRPTSDREGTEATCLRPSVRSARLFHFGSASANRVTTSVSSEDRSSTSTAVGSSIGESSVTRRRVPESSTCAASSSAV